MGAGLRPDTSPDNQRQPKMASDFILKAGNRAPDTCDGDGSTGSICMPLADTEETADNIAGFFLTLNSWFQDLDNKEGNA